MPLSRHVVAVSFLIIASTAHGEENLESDYREIVRPILESSCWECHRGEATEGDLDLSADRDLTSVIQNFRRWSVVLDRLREGDMPPEGADSQPTKNEREAVMQWIERVKWTEAARTSGDPGIVLAHRLSSNEYNYTIRDLIGADIRPAAAFPVDPANEAGFDNSGESLTMSPALLKKYLDAGRTVANHLALTPSGFEFAPHPVITDTDRDKFCVNRIIDFYQRQRTDYADYFYTLWFFQNRVSLGRAEATLQDLASERELSSRYCQTLYHRLYRSGDGPPDSVGPMAVVCSMLNELPDGSTTENITMASEKCQEIARFIRSYRAALVPDVPNMTAPEIHSGSQSFVLWKNRQFVANRRRYVPRDLRTDDLAPEKFGIANNSAESRKLRVTDETDMAQYNRSLEDFCHLFPDQFFVSERARVYLDPKKEKKLTGRYLSAGFHSQMGYFRDDEPLYDLMLSDRERFEIDRLWLELDFVTSAPMRQYAGFIWFDRTDSKFMRDRVFDRYRAEDKDCTSDEKVAGLAAAYCEKARRVGASDEALEAIEFYFSDMSKTFRRLERLKLESEPIQLDALVRFAERAFRRPLLDHEAESLRAFYRDLRDIDGLSHEDAIRDGVVRILMSPDFCYRIDCVSKVVDEPTPQETPPQQIQPLDDFALANRLSYFLWSSMPDERLMKLAAAGQLHRPDVLVEEARRMLADDRVDGFVTEFTGNWLDFRRFNEHNGVDRERFPMFNDELRKAMADEPQYFFRDLIKRDGSVLEFLYADHTFVNRILAMHYGIVDSGNATSRFLGDQEQWIKVEGADRYGRGGLLPMAVFLTANSPGLRTSPVKRGNWLIRRMLGEQVPAPPTAVPELPSDESNLGELTLRETLARHRQDTACAGCHDRIDSMGLVFEGYGPVGELRDVDFGGRKIDDSAVFPDDSKGRGLEGLRRYIRDQREDDFLDNFCRKLLSYGLGRTLQLSDELAVKQMKNRLADNGERFSILLEEIISSPAFLNKRVRLPLDDTVILQ